MSFGYLYNDANQRTRVNLADGSNWIYTYDALGQVTSGKKYWQDNSPVPGQQFEYAHDDIGNRSQTKAGGDQNGQNLRQASYTANNLNQYSSRGVPGTLDIIGIAISTNSVSVNGGSAAYRRSEYYWSPLTVDNGSGPVWQMVTNTSGGSSLIGGALVPPNSQTMQYDLDGNLTNDLVWNYTWDAENRLIRMTNASTLTASNRLQVAFEYDWKGRRIRKTVTRLDTSTVILENTFLYDGWNLIAELNGTNNNIIRDYLWGTDLSGSMQGAGGVGGLLKMANYTPSGTNYFVVYDGNGNVTGLIHADSGTNMVALEYGPFGEPIRNSGAWSTAAKTCPIRFSSKYIDDETDLVYYGHRYYSPSLGRWLSRDPNGERGCRNLFGYVHNNPILNIDKLGLETAKVNNGEFDLYLSPWYSGIRAGIEVNIVFKPKGCPACRLVKLVQVARVMRNDSIYTGDISAPNRNNLMTRNDAKQGVEEGWFVDIDSEKWNACSPDASIYYRDSHSNAPPGFESKDGSSTDESSLWDGPAAGFGFSMSFETCARCVDNGTYLGCVKWGWKADKLGTFPTPYPIIGSESPSVNFNAAIGRFNSFFGTGF